MTVPEFVAPGVYRVDAIGPKNAISVVLLENDDGWTLVDTGVAGSVDRVKEALTSLGSGPEDLRRIFITHHHGDHTRGLKGLLEWAPDAEVGATAYEAEIVSGARPPDPRSGPLWSFVMRNQAPAPAPVARVLREGDLVSGFRVVATPGHTLGHASLLRDADGLLFTADAFGSLWRRVRVGVLKPFCADPPLAKRSAQRLLGEDFATVMFAHGPVLRSGGREVLRGAVDRCGY